jgi:transcriptional regulator with XRE-family HTH domain
MSPLNEGHVAAIRSRRRDLGWSSRELAEASGISHSVLRNIESRRKQALTVDDLLAISGALGVSATDIIPELSPNAEAGLRERVTWALWPTGTKTRADGGNDDTQG